MAEDCLGTKCIVTWTIYFTDRFLQNIWNQVRCDPACSLLIEAGFGHQALHKIPVD
jgi:hypothetical protein